MKKTVGKVLLALLLVLLAVVAGFGIFYSSRIKTIRSIRKLSDYEDGYNLYRMDVSYNYDLENLIRYGVSDNQAMLDSILKEAMPLLPIHMTAPNFGCSAFSVSDTDGCTLMGRNYDFKQDTSAMLVDTPIRAITNFYGLYIDRVQPNQRNGIYGHGKERYDSIEQVLDNNSGSITNDIAWQALQASAQLPNPEDVTSNTQWSLIYNDTEKTAQFVLRRNWNDVFLYDLNTNDVT